MEKSKILKNGKIPDEELSEILSKYTNAKNKRVLLGPKLGEDAGIIDMGRKYTSEDNCLCVCVDPIIVDIKNAPYYAVAINVNDLVTRGAKPRWASASIFFPDGSTIKDVEQFFEQLHAAIKPYNISLVTGHTEVTSLIKNPGIIMTMLGEVKKSDVITTGGAKKDDILIITGGAGIEGTSIIASDLHEKLEQNVPQEIISRAQGFIYDPGICIAEAAYTAWKYKPNSLHDPTEGGIRKGIEELAIASDKGVLIDFDKIPIRNETKILCEAIRADPLGIFGSGALLISIPYDRGQKLLKEYNQKGILAGEIGRVVEKGKGRMLQYKGELIPLEASYTDGLIDKLS